MMFRSLGSISNDQKGFTLIELMIGIAISAIIIGAITTSIFQVVTGSARSKDHMTAVNQVQNAGYWVSHDGQMAQSVELADDSGGFPFKLTWTLGDGNRHEVIYTLEDNELQREHYINTELEATTIVAKDINPDETNCEFGAGTFSLPDIGDAFIITDGIGGDSGVITVTTGVILVTLGGTTATYDAGTGAWTTPSAGDTVTVAATSLDTTGSWTLTIGTVATAISVDVLEDNASVTGGTIIFTVTATVQEQSESRVYEIVPRPS